MSYKIYNDLYYPPDLLYIVVLNLNSSVYAKLFARKIGNIGVAL